MKTPRSTRRRLVATIAGTGLAVLFGFGCGDNDEFPKRFAVYGTVSYKGKPLERGKIDFIPTNPPGHPASGSIVNGAFSLTTHTKDDGAVPGSYKVTVVAVEYDPKMKADLEKESNGGFPHVPVLGSRAFFKAQRSSRHLAPVKYERTTTTDLTANVEERSNRIDFDLKD